MAAPQAPRRSRALLPIVLMVWFGALGDVLLARGARQAAGAGWQGGSVAAVVLTHWLTNRSLWMGVASLIVFFLCYLLALSRADYSYVTPASASSYVVVTLLGWALLGEAVTRLRWLGVLVICAGVWLVTRTAACTTGESRQ